MVLYNKNKRGGGKINVKEKSKAEKGTGTTKWSKNIQVNMPKVERKMNGF